MRSLNPFKIISNIENEVVDFQKVGIKGAIGETFIYFIILFFTGILFINKKFSLKIFILNALAAFILFVIITVVFYTVYGTIVNKADICKKVFRKFTVRNIIYLTIVLFGAEIISNNLVVFVLDPFSKILMPKLALEAFSESTQMPFIIYVCIIGPAVEEFVFRAVILGGLLKKYSIKKSIIISSILFGISHLNGIQFINAFLVGILLGYIYSKTRSIYLCMYFHMAFNSIIFAHIYMIYIVKNQNLLLTVLVTILGLVLIIYGLKEINNFKVSDL